MKVFFPLGAFYPSQIGGPCNTLYWHTCALNKNGITPVIVTTSLGIPDGAVTCDRWLTMDSGEIYYSSSEKFKFKLLKCLWKEICRADIVHLNSLFDKFSIVSLFICLFSGKKRLIWSVRGELNDKALQFGWLKKMVFLFFIGIIKKKIIFHSTSSKESAEISKQFGEVAIVKLPNFILQSNRLSLPINRDFLFVGRIHPIKGLDKLIRGLAVSNLFRSSEFKLLIAGSYEERFEKYYDELIQLIDLHNLQSKIEFLGHVSGKVKDTLYAQSYMLLLPSETENFGNVVIESLNQGTPVMASEGTPWSMLKFFNCGYHVSNEPNVIGSTIDDIIRLDLKSYSEMRSNAISLVDENFDVNKRIVQWLDIYCYENKR